MTCFHAEISCPSIVNIGFTYGDLNPTTDPDGTVVFFSGGAGDVPFSESQYGAAYLAAGYQVVEMAWDTAWENTLATTGTDIGLAACRPATFLNYIHQSVYKGGGMCAQGESAGSAEVAYSLAWYGSAAYLDKVELISGPVFSDIAQGCTVPNGAKITVCRSGQLGCNGSAWPDSPAYVLGAENAVAAWSGDPTCNDGNKTTRASTSKWKAMSIVNGTSSTSFNYPQTAVAGWLCSNLSTAQNNSAAEGEFFYQQFTSARQTAGYSLTRIDNCGGDEGVSQGTTPQGVNGLVAISTDMIAGCIKRH